MTTFLFNPYDATLNLSDKEDRKLYQDTCKGLTGEDRFDGKRESYPNFVKLIEQSLQDVRVMETLEISTRWDQSATNPDDRRLPMQDDTIDIFRSHKATEQQVADHCDLVWANRTHIHTPKYFARFGILPKQRWRTQQLQKHKDTEAHHARQENLGKSDAKLPDRHPRQPQ